MKSCTIHLLLLTCVATKFTVGFVGFDLDLETCNNTCLQTWTVSDPLSIINCKCASSLSIETNSDPSCDITIENVTNYHILVAVDAWYCMTFNERTNISYIGNCPYNSLLFNRQGGTRPRLPIDARELNNFVCNVSDFIEHPRFCGQQRRRGFLCSVCEDGLAPAVMSYTHQCVECKWSGLPLFLALSFVPATILCFFIIFFRVNVLAPSLNAIVLFGHVMVSHINFMPCMFLYYAQQHHVSTLVIALATISGFVNMDFFVYVIPSFCISNKMSTLAVIALDYTVALYPLALSALIYFLIEAHDSGFPIFVWLWRPFHARLVRFRRQWDIKGSIINAFATLYVLSFTKVISTSINLMLTKTIVSSCGSVSWSYLYYNASCALFQPCHLPYAALALSITIIVTIIPSIFIFLHSCKFAHKYSWCHCLCHRLTLGNEIAKIFHHSFKDGIDEGTLDCRWFAGCYLALRIGIVTAIVSRNTQQIQIISSVVGLILVALFQPHTQAIHNVTDAILFGGLVVLFVILPAGQSQHATQISIFVILFFLVIIFLGWKLIWKYKDLVKNTKLYMYVCHLREVFKNKFAVNNSIQNVTTQEREPLISVM